MFVQNNRFLSEFSTFRIGGPIRHFVEAANPQEMVEAFEFAHRLQIPFLVLGKGSNCLFSDKGFDGLVILNKIAFIEWNGPQIRVGSGYSFSLLGMQTAREGWSGLEFASGIPATVGGALFMNAGAHGKEVCDPLVSAVFLKQNGETLMLRRGDLSFGYRASPFQSMKGAILEATFALTQSPNARDSQLKIIGYRMKTQPLKDRSAGCVFRNPSQECSAGALIERCGLKGLRIGDAKVSEIHANFIVNVSQATSAEVRALIAEVQGRVKGQTGIDLECEVRLYE